MHLERRESAMGGEFIKLIKDAFSEDGIVDLMKKVKLIDDTNIKEVEVRKYINDCHKNYEKFKATCFHAWGAASDATNIFFTIILSKNEDISPTEQTNKPIEERGPHLSPTIRSFIAKYDQFDIDIDKVDHQIGVMKQKSKCMLVDMEKQAMKVKHAADEASTVFVTSLSERMKVAEEVEEDKKDE